MEISQYLRVDVPIRDGTVLSPSYIPPIILHREEQLKRIGSNLGLLLKGLRVSHMRIYGPAGTGKTLIIRSFLQELQKKAEKALLIYTICGSSSLESLQNIGRATPGRVLLPKRGLSLEEMWQEYKYSIADKYTVIILDEADRLIRGETNPWLLYLLSNEDNISVVLVYNQPEGTADIFESISDKRITSRLAGVVVYFPPYDANQLADILEQRIKLGFKEGTVEGEAITLCAALTAREEGGDARYALELLDSAAKMAMEKKEPVVRAEHIRMSHSVLKAERLYRPVRGLNKKEATIMLAVATGRNTKDAIARFAADYDISQRLVTALVVKLKKQGLLNVRHLGKGRGRGWFYTYSLPPEYSSAKVQEICREKLV